MTAATAMSPAMTPFATGLPLGTPAGLLGRRTLAGLILGKVIPFDRDPVTLWPGTIGGRIALRANKDPRPTSGCPPASGCPGRFTFVAEMIFRYGSFRGRLAPGVCADRGG